MKGELTFMDKLQEILGKVSIKLSGNLGSGASTAFPKRIF